MEENTKPTKKSLYISTDEMISKMRIAFSNAKLPEILPQLQTLGYTEEKLNTYLQKVAELEQLMQNQKKEYAEQYAETEKFNQKRQEIDELYRRHIAFCKILFKGNVKAISVLELNAGRKNAYASWHQQVSNFYGQLLGNSDFLAKVGTINITQTDLEAQKTALQELSTLKENQKKEAGEAQKATEIRDEALDKLYPSYTELVAYAKVLFQDDQILEALGIVVKR
ncbi:hypothetical protein [Capnocytophaga canimorsus]|uniref:Uncharacterized protein n=2 Tax=Capnocytophaga canimorsus TaxID=28188 RepID=F9YSL5_CAPCC|nr:hypothetical protein [Capnocytophaga canimorsus]AEK22688.1 Conserved hypothetical protein [Capnocytophaga canimorsus Cc5]ATA77844.1 hypothetical protein CGC47_09775 [Capnocytophaga canimorsus]PJI79738.1 hypothetical protein CLV61_1316 [Capnocytophaga canimorsus]CEN39791.1 conserved hypothetical protein [Capnocytophaga canimorsus]CEN50450.1 conserved hypothetical protein [Capnocytophaga canimorsus]